MGLNGTLFVTFIASFIGALTTAFDFDMRLRYTLAAIVCLMTAIPLSINFILFLRSGHSRKIAFLREFQKVIYSDYYEINQINRTLKGMGLYCNQSFIEPSILTDGNVFILKDVEMMLNKIPKLEKKISNAESKISKIDHEKIYMYKKRISNIRERIEESSKNVELECVYNLLIDDNVVFEAKKLDLRAQESFKIYMDGDWKDPCEIGSCVQYFKIYISHQLCVEMEYRRHPLKKSSKAKMFGSYKITNSLYNLNKNHTLALRLKHNETSAFEDIEEVFMKPAQFNNFLYSLYCFKSSPSTGIVRKVGFRRNILVFHSRSLQELMNIFSGNRTYIPFKKYIDIRHVIEGESVDDDFKTIINSASAEIFSLSELAKKFGSHLAGILFCHNKSFWGGINENAFDFIINNDSCRFYRKIGSNYKSKKYLADVSLLREKSGLPRMTWVDLKVSPSSHAYDFMKFCKKSDKVMNVLVQNKHWVDLEKERETLSEVKQKEIKSLKEGNIDDKSVINIREVSKKISDIDNYRKKISGNFKCVNEKRYKNFLSQISEYKPNSDLYLKALKKENYVSVNKSTEDIQKEIDGIGKNIEKWKSELKKAMESKIIMDTKLKTEVFIEKMKETKMEHSNEDEQNIKDEWQKVCNGFSQLKMTKEVENIISKNPFELDFEIIESDEVSVDTNTLIYNCDKVKTRSLRKKKCKLFLTSKKAIDAIVRKKTQFVQKAVDIESFVRVLDSLDKEKIKNGLSIKGFYRKIKRKKYKKSRLKYALKRTVGLKVGSKRDREFSTDGETFLKKHKSINFCYDTFKRSIGVIGRRLRITNLIKKADSWKKSYEKRLNEKKEKEQFELRKERCRIKNEEVNRGREKYAQEKRMIAERKLKEAAAKLEEEEQRKKKEKEKERLNIYGVKFSSEIEITDDLIDLPHSFHPEWLSRRKHITNARELFAEFRLKCNDKDKESTMIRNLSEDELIMLDEDVQYELIMLAMASV